jgi:hypothetical protein
MVRRIGYLAGTDSTTLTRIAIDGVGTIPLSNGWDDHGKYLAHITLSDGLSAIVAPFHKISAAPGDPVGPHDILSPAIDAGIPVLVIVPEDIKDKVVGMLTRKEAEPVSPEKLYIRLKEILKI